MSLKREWENVDAGFFYCPTCFIKTRGKKVRPIKYTDPPRICVNCKHFATWEVGQVEVNRCHRPDLADFIHPVTGQSYDFDCEDERSEMGKCGTNGKFWEKL